MPIQHLPTIKPGRSRHCLLLALLISIALPGLSAQAALPVFELAPAVPLAGQQFELRLRVSGLEASGLRLLPPETGAAIVYLGSSAQPLSGAAGPAVQLTYTFTSRPERLQVLPASGPGASGSAGTERFAQSSVSLSVISGKVQRSLGTWNIRFQLPSSLVSAAIVRAEWKVPSSVYRYQSLRGSLVASDGRPLVLQQALSLPGVVFELLPGGDSFLLAARQSFTLPALSFNDGERTIQVAARTVDCLELPTHPEGISALGQYAARYIADLDHLRPGSLLSAQLLLEGIGAPVFLKQPVLVLQRQEEAGWQTLEWPTAAHHHQQFRPEAGGWNGTVATYQEMRIQQPGEYRLLFDAGVVFNPGDGPGSAAAGFYPAVLAPRHFRVKSPVEKTANLNTEQATVLRRILADSLALKPDFELEAAALGAALSPSLKYALENAVRVPLPDKYAAALSARERLGVAALLLLQDRKQAALNVLLDLQADYYHPDLNVLQHLAQDLLGYPRQHGYFLPPPLWLLPFFGFFAMVSVLMVLAGWRKSGRDRSRSFIIAVLFSIVAIGSAALWLSAVQERRHPLFAANSEYVRSVPAASAQLLFVSPIGLTGRVVNRTKDWLFVEYADGRHGWIPVQDGLDQN